MLVANTPASFVASHERLVDAIEAGDIDASLAAIDEHIAPTSSTRTSSCASTVGAELAAPTYAAASYRPGPWRCAATAGTLN